MKYKVIESKHWKNAEGRTASIYGALPYIGDPGTWKKVSRGFTLYNTVTGVVGTGREPFTTREEAQSVCDRLNSPEPLEV